MHSAEKITALVFEFLPLDCQHEPGFETSAVDPKTEEDRDVLVPVIRARNIAGVRVSCAERALPESDLRVLLSARVSERAQIVRAGA